MFYLHCIKSIAHKISNGIKIQIGKQSFIVIKGRRIYYVYKKYRNSIIYIDNIKC